MRFELFDEEELWFDVGIKRYTTTIPMNYAETCCGLM